MFLRVVMNGWLSKTTPLLAGKVPVANAATRQRETNPGWRVHRQMETLAKVGPAELSSVSGAAFSQRRWPKPLLELLV
jgi:hypothetical protein